MKLRHTFTGAWLPACFQVFYSAGDDQSFFEYDREELENSQSSFLHDLSELEVEGAWARCRCAVITESAPA